MLAYLWVSYVVAGLDERRAAVAAVGTYATPVPALLRCLARGGVLGAARSAGAAAGVPGAGYAVPLLLCLVCALTWMRLARCVPI